VDVSGISGAARGARHGQRTPGARASPWVDFLYIFRVRVPLECWTPLAYSTRGDLGDFGLALR
jgi:hypothetical protein